MNKDRVKNIIIIVLLLLCIGAITLYSKSNTKVNEISNLYSAINDTLNISVNKLNQEIAKRKVLQTANVNDFLLIQSKDSSINILQNEIKLNKKRLKDAGSSIAYLQNQTGVNTTVNTDVILPDNIDTTNVIYPQYKFKIKNLGKWVKGGGISTKDSTTLSLSIVNEYAISLGYERPSLFKKKVPYAVVKNFNPYTETKEFRTYSVSLPEPKAVHFGLIAGYTVNTSLEPSFSVGVGISINPFRL